MREQDLLLVKWQREHKMSMYNLLVPLICRIRSYNPIFLLESLRVRVESQWNHLDYRFTEV